MTISTEDYLKAIYELDGDIKRVSNKEIADNLLISPPSVSEMIKKLQGESYIDYIPYKGIILTEKGLNRAVKTKRRHLLWEKFLIDQLGYEVDEAHDEAEKLEHFTSDKLEKRLDKYLGEPKLNTKLGIHEK